MIETDLRTVPPFDTLPVLAEADASELCRPADPKFSGVIYEADDVSQIRDFLQDRQLVPKGSYRDESGKLRAIFWQLR